MTHKVQKQQTMPGWLIRQLMKEKNQIGAPHSSAILTSNNLQFQNKTSAQWRIIEFQRIITYLQKFQKKIIKFMLQHAFNYIPVSCHHELYKKQ